MTAVSVQPASRVTGSTGQRRKRTTRRCRGELSASNYRKCGARRRLEQPSSQKFSRPSRQSLGDEWRLPSGPSALLTKALMQTNIEHIVKTMGSHADNAVVQERCCAELCEISHRDDYSREAIVSLAGIEMVLMAMSEHVNEANVQMAACSVLLQLLGKVSSNTLSFVSLGGVRAVVNTMAAHRYSQTLQITCCRILAITAECNTECIIQLVDSLAGCAVVEAMSAHMMIPEVQEIGCLVLQKIITPTSVDQESSNCGVVGMVLRAMQVHVASSAIQMAGCKFLSSIVSSSASFKKEMIENGGVEIVIHAMSAYLENSCIQRSASLALLRLVLSDVDIAQTISDSGGIRALLIAMTHHRDKQRIQVVGCRLLKELADASMDRSTFSACVLAVLRAIEKHPGLRKVQKASSDALKKLTAIDNCLVTGMCLGRCGRLGEIATSRALDAVRICETPDRSARIHKKCGKRMRLQQLKKTIRFRTSFA